MYPEPRELTTAADVIANRKAVRTYFQTLHARHQPAPPEHAAPSLLPPEPSPIVVPYTPHFTGPAPRAMMICDMVAAHFSIARERIRKDRIDVTIVRPRRIAIYLCDHCTSMSHKASARFFGRDPSTVYNAIHAVKAAIATNAEFAATIAEFIRTIEETPIAPPPPVEPPPEPIHDPLAPQASVLRICQMVCRHYGLTLTEIRGHSRIRFQSVPRHAAMYLIVRHAGHTTTQTARLFNGRDHSTVVTAIKRFPKKMASNPALAAAVREFVRQIEGWAAQLGERVPGREVVEA